MKLLDNVGYNLCNYDIYMDITWYNRCITSATMVASPRIEKIGAPSPGSHHVLQNHRFEIREICQRHQGLQQMFLHLIDGWVAIHWDDVILRDYLADGETTRKTWCKMIRSMGFYHWTCGFPWGKWLLNADFFPSFEDWSSLFSRFFINGAWFVRENLDRKQW